MCWLPIDSVTKHVTNDNDESDRNERERTKEDEEERAAHQWVRRLLFLPRPLISIIWVV